MSQCSRILAALENGPVSPIDFAAPDVIDGGAPIMRVAARIQDLRDQGLEIATATAANGTAIYTITQGTDQGSSTAAESASSSVASPNRAALVSAPTNDSGGAPPPPESALFEVEGLAPRHAYKDIAA